MQTLSRGSHLMHERNSIPDTDKIRELPALATKVISEQWEDQNKHVNVGFYMALYNEAGWAMLNLIGIDQSYFSEQQMGIVDLENHIRYLDELHVGDRVSAYCRYLDYDEKRLQGIVFIVNETTNKLASTIEFLAISMDLQRRKVAELPDNIAARLADVTNTHQQFEWMAPTRTSMPNSGDRT